MNETLVVGVGYLGRRLLDRDIHARGVTRADFDLDRDATFDVDLADAYDVVYTVPPSRASEADVRLERLLANLDPVPSRFVYISTTGVYGDHRGAAVSEESPVAPATERALRRVNAENTLHDWAADKNCSVVVLRVPGIYGPGRLGIERIREQVPVVRDEDVGPGNRIHVEDLASCCVAALSEHVPAGIYNVGDGDHRSSTWFVGEVARQLELSPPPAISIEQAAKEFSPMRMSFLQEQRRVDTSKMRDVLGVELAYPNPADGIAASL